MGVLASATGTEAKRSLRVLVVDDSAPVRATVRQMVGLCGDGVFEVVGEAADGTEAVDMAIDLKPDAILMDINLPGCDGITAAARIHEAVPARIVMVSVENGREYFRRAMQVGAVDYLVKPFTPEGLADALRGIEAVADDAGGAGEVPVSPAGAPSRGQLIAVCGAKGGVGASTVALNLSLALGRQLPAPGAALCDLDPAGGLLGVMAGLPPSARDLTEPVALGGGAVALVPETDLKQAVWEYGAVVCDLGRAAGLCDGLAQALEWGGAGVPSALAAAVPSALAAAVPSALAAGVPADLGATESGEPWQAPEAVYRTASAYSAGSDPSGEAAGLAEPPGARDATRLVLVVTGEVVSLHSAALLLKGPAARLPSDRICLVVNRIGRPGAIRPDEVAKALNLSSWIGIPEETAAIEAANLGRPLLEHRGRSHFSAAVERLAAQLAAPVPAS